MGRGAFPGRGRGGSRYGHTPLTPGQLARLNPGHAGPLDLGGAGGPIEIEIRVVNQIAYHPLQPFQVVLLARQCLVYSTFLVPFLDYMKASSGRILRDLGKWIPAVSGRMRESVYISEYLRSGIPLFGCRLAYAGVEFGADSRRSRERYRRRARGRVDDLADSITRYLHSYEFQEVMISAARRAHRRCFKGLEGNG